MVRILLTDHGKVEIKDMLLNSEDNNISNIRIPKNKMLETNASDASIRPLANLLSSKLRDKSGKSQKRNKKVTIRINEDKSNNNNLSLLSNQINNNISKSKNIQSKVITTTEPKILKITDVSLKQKKINLPKKVMEMYNSDSYNMGSIGYSPNFNTDNNIKNSSEPFFLYKNTEKIPIKEIINNEAMNKLKTELSKEMKYRKDNYRFKYNVFNTEEIDDEKQISHIKKDLNNTIDKNYIELITYLHNKKSLSKEIIKKIKDLNPERLSHWNKVCLLLNNSTKQDIQKVLKDKVENINKTLSEEAQSKIQEGLKYARENLKISKQYVDKNKDKSSGHRRLYEKFDDIKFYWIKNDLERLSSSKKSLKHYDKHKSVLKNYFNEY